MSAPHDGNCPHCGALVAIANLLRPFDPAEMPTPAEVRAGMTEEAVQAIARAVVAQLRATPASSRPPDAVLVGRAEAARLLGISIKALDMRVTRGQVPGVVRTGRRVQFSLAVLQERIARRASK